jgi:choline dehydrogenase-like flavoprotein
MIYDCEAITQNDIKDSVVSIIGAGIAGITLALELEKIGFTVNLLEGGGLEFESDSHSLYRGNQSGREYYDLDASRVRMFGGTSTHWAGNCRELSAIDFKPRDWIDNSGWPISYAELKPYYAKASTYLQLDTRRNNLPSNWSEQAMSVPVNSELSELFVTQFSPIGPDKPFFTALNFGKEYKSRIEKSKLINLFLHANVTCLNGDTSGEQVKSIQVKTFTGKSFNFKSVYFILATGGIENARLLLISNQANKVGLGISQENVGRYFMEHAEVKIGHMLASQTDLSVYDMFLTPLNRVNANKSTQFRTKVYYTFNEDVQKSNRLLSTKISLNRDDVQSSLKSKGFNSFRRLYNDMKNGVFTDGFPYHLRNVIVDIDDVAKGLKDKITAKEPKLNLFNVQLQTEHEPQRTNRVTLIDEKDKLGMPKVNLHWSLSKNDYRSIRVAADLIAREFGAAGVGRMKITIPENDEQLENEIKGAWHHMGTTRMGVSEKNAVVDLNCKVFGVSNLFIAGSSVFPTGGHSVPTFTIAALAVRLAQHLKDIINEH